jgi:Tfp pilus tip-associated adhesin PilY1
MKSTGYRSKIAMWLFACLFGSVLVPAWSFAVAYDVDIQDLAVSKSETSATMDFTVRVTPPVASGTTVYVQWGLNTNSPSTAAVSTDFTGPGFGFVAITSADGGLKTVSIGINNEQIVEGDETFSFFIYSPTVVPEFGNSVAAIAGANVATGTILNDDSASLTFGNASMNEANGNLDFSVTSSNQVEASANVTMCFNTTDIDATAGNDYTAVSVANAPLVYGGAPGGTALTISVPILDDTIVEGDEAFSLTLTENSANITVDTSPVTGTILNTDNVSFALSGPASIDENISAGFASYTVTASVPIEPTANDIIVDYKSLSLTGNTAIPSEDYSGNGSLTFNSGFPGPHIFNISIVDDNIVEGDESYTTTISIATGSGVIGTGTLQTTIINDENPTLNIDSLFRSEGDSGTTQLAFTVQSSLEVAPNAVVSFDYTTTAAGNGLGDNLAENSDISGTLSGNDIIIQGGNAAPIIIDIVDDNLVELDESFDVIIGNQKMSGSGTVFIGVGTGTGTILNDDGYEIRISADQIVFEDESFNPFKVELSNPVEWDFDIPYTLSGTAVVGIGNDFTIAPATPVHIAGGETVKDIVVTLLDDGIAEPDATGLPHEFFTIDLAAPSNTTGFTGFAPGSTTGTIKNDDHVFTIQKTVEPDKGTLTGGGHTAPDTGAVESFIVADGSDISFSMASTDSCYHIQDFQVDGVSESDIASYNNTSPDYNTYTTDSYAIKAVDGSHAITLDFAINTYTINTVALGGAGTVTLSGSAEVDCKTASPTITVTPDSESYITWIEIKDGTSVTQVPGAYGQNTPWTYDISSVTSDYTITAAFGVKITMLNEPPHGTTEIRIYNSQPGGFADGTLLYPNTDDSPILYADYGAELRFQTSGEAHTVQGPDYIESTSTYDDRTHQHHLSKIIDNNDTVFAGCGTGFACSDYRSDATCQHTVTSLTESHDLEIHFTGIADVSAHGFGKITSLLGSDVDATSSGNEKGSFEFEAGEGGLLNFSPLNGWYIESLKYKITPENITDEIELISLTRATSLAIPTDLDKDYGVQINFTITQFSIVATSTFEQLLFDDIAMNEADKISVENGNTEFLVDYDTDQSFFVLLNDPDFSVTGVSIDNTFISIENIRNYAANPSKNPNESVYGFSIDPTSPPVDSTTKEKLTITFTSVQVSHHLEIRDYDNVIIADVPLDAQANPNPPALMFVTDDSGSMDWEFLIEGANQGTYLGTVEYLWSFDVVPSSVRAYTSTALSSSSYDKWKTQWSGYNKMFYNPAVVYVPWPDFTGTIDHDNNNSTDEISSRLPATDTTDDGLAHADIYRPRHHPWHNVDCDAALAMSSQRRLGVQPTATQINSLRTTCNASSGSDDYRQTFDMDGKFMALTGSSSDDNTLELDSEYTTRTGTWTRTSNNSSKNNDYRYNSGSGTAKYSYTPTESSTHTVEVSWRAYGSRSTAIPYRIKCPGCTPAVDYTVNVNQRNDGYYDDGMVTLHNSLNVTDTSQAITVTVGPTPSGSLSIDAARFTWEVTGANNELSAIINAHYYTFDDVDQDEVQDTGEAIWLVNLTDPVTYSKVKDSTNDIESSNLESPLLAGAAGLPATLVTYVAPDDANAFVLERQNFADWYSSYRTRQLAATSAEARAIEKMSNVEVGIHTINYNGDYGISQSALPVNVWGKRDKSNYLYYLLYSFKLRSYGTPLRSGLRDVARYFDATDGYSGTVTDTTGQSGLTKSDYTCGTGSSDSDDYLSPFAFDPNDSCAEKSGDRCKVTIAVLITDGYWNGYYSDGISSTDVPLEAGHSSKLETLFDDSLSRTAYYYRFKRDLMNDTEGDDQFMITYGVAFGLNGERAFSEDLKCSILDASECPTWPAPSSNNASTIDDLWHASVVGDGKYLNADSPDALVKALSSIVNDIEGKEGSSASLAVNGDELYETVGDDLRMYQASWNSTGWSGDLKSYAIKECSTSDGVVNLSSCEKWSAMTTLDNRSTGRIIASYNPWLASASKGIAFQYNELSDIQKTQLFPYFASTIDTPAENVLNFLRGDVTLDATVAAEFRSRPHLLGDIVNSQGRFQRYATDDVDGNAPDTADWKPTYTGVIFIGANDGMLHAFASDDGDNGKELFAYVPGLVYHNLRNLTDPDYLGMNHKMFVDATPYTTTMKYGTEKKTILIGGLGKGGKGFYALDITNAHNTITSEAELKSRVLWEYPPATDILVSAKIANFTSDRIYFNEALTEQVEFAAKYTHFEVVGANDSSGAVNATNDGTYEIDTIGWDADLGKNYIQIPQPSFTEMTNKTITILGSISDQDMGYSFSKPILVKSNDSTIGQNGWVVIFGNGFGSERGDSVLHILHPLTGALIKKIYTTQDGVHGDGFSGLATPRVIDINNDLQADYVYGGDLDGLMWKFDLSDSDSSQWQVAFCDGSASDDISDCVRTDNGAVTTPGTMIPKPLFGAGLKRPITSAPDIMRHESGLGYMVIFGTGKYLGWLDLVNTDTQTLYGIWDWAPNTHDEGFLGSRGDVNGFITLDHYPKTDGLGAPLRSLLKQEILLEGGITDVDTGVMYSYYRIPSFYRGDWRTALNSELSSGTYFEYPKENGPETMRVPLAHMGWAFDLPGKLTGVNPVGPKDHNSDNYDLGERQINDTIIRGGKAIMITFGLNGDKCGSSAYSFLNERDAMTGGMLFSPNFDLNGDGAVNQKDIINIDPDGTGGDDPFVGIPTDKLFEGRMFNPVIVADPEEDGEPPSEDKYMSGSALGQGLNGAKIEETKESSQKTGVYYWQQVQ